jgi:hypothetical protein
MAVLAFLTISLVYKLGYANAGVVVSGINLDK